MGLLAGAGRSKEEVNYRQFERCLSCTNFYAPGSCKLVSGNISPDAVCNLWAMQEKKTMGMDGSDYLKEYTKNPGGAARDLPGGGT